MTPVGGQPHREPVRQPLRAPLASRTIVAEATSVTSHQRWVRSQLSVDETAEMELVDELAEQLKAHIDATAETIAALHVHGASSSAIQGHFALLLGAELGFEEEVVLTPQDGLVTQARPDFFYRFDTQRGILAEVERGGTTTNNHDLKDLWKAHVAPDAQHLFLIVPNNNWRADGQAREKPFPLVARRLGAFFGDPRREIDVASLHIFGY